MKREELKCLGWRQFCLIQSDCHKEVNKCAHYNLPLHQYLLVITQTCDLINDDINKEPYIEVVPLKKLGENNPSSNDGYGKNARRLEIPLNIEGRTDTYVLEAKERFFVRHELLGEIKPHAFIEDQNTIDCLSDWVIARYNRTAFPEEFIRRILPDRPSRKKAEKIFGGLKLVKGVYIRIMDGKKNAELLDSESYIIEIVLLMKEEDYSNELTYQTYKGYCEELKSYLNDCTGIEVDDVKQVSISRIMLDEYLLYDKWDYSYLSFRAPGLHETPI